MRFHLVALLMIASFQSLDFKDVSNREGLQIAYNRFTDQTILITKRETAYVVLGKSSLLDPSGNRPAIHIATAAMWAGAQPKEQIKEVLLVFFPNPKSGIAATLNQIEGHTFYIKPDSEVIAIADGERLKLGKIVKSGQFDARGNYNGDAYLPIPLESFKKMAKATKLELSLGGLEVVALKRFAPRILALAQEIDSRQPSNPSEQPAPVPAAPEARSVPPTKPTPTPAPKICYEGGRKVPCP